MPTCVGFGTGSIGIIARSFSRNPEWAASLLGLPFAPLRASALCRRDFASPAAPALGPQSVKRRVRLLPVSGHSFAPYAGTGISTCRPSAPFGLALGPDLPRADEPSPGNLGLSVCRIPTCVIASPHTGILSSVLSTAPYGTASPCTQRSPTTRTSVRILASAGCSAPVHFRRRATRLVSCYALFKGWLLLSQPPSCLCISTSFSTQHAFWGLGWRSGLFPS